MHTNSLSVVASVFNNVRRDQINVFQGRSAQDIHPETAKGPGRIPEDGSAPNDLKKWQGLPIVSRGAAILLMALYLTYLYFQLVSH
ncbi:hypothetical protein Moror_2727 [Moniliophthora roreri MCA 2997]|uniref:Uncharacterized protein n=1 Tax=Moniliophthora roreri (strain MCA 2997) TaxID=1381753 RepID=V2XFU8_MONRO|nr:hypothetical protein Moror_2727 [Moniliophthora roreri MCA 2997]